MKQILGEALAVTVGAFGVLIVKGIVRALKLAADMETTWITLRQSTKGR